MARVDRVRDDVAMNRTALVIGESLVDIVSNSDGSSVEHPGGSPANVAVALARLGADVGLATAYADDRLGGLLDQHFANAGVSLAGDPHVLARTSSAVATLDDTGAASYVFDLEWDLPPVPTADPPALVHTGSLAAVMEPGAGTVAAAIAALAPTSTVSYDINARPAATGVDAEIVARVEALVALSDVVKASDEDLEVLYPGSEVEECVERLLGLGAGAVVVTWGGKGASCHTRAGGRRGGRRTGGGGRHDRGRRLVLRCIARRPPAPGPARRSAAVRPARAAARRLARGRDAGEQSRRDHRFEAGREPAHRSRARGR